MDCGCSPRKLDTSCPKEDACTTRAVLETKTPEEMILFRKVVVPASIGTDTDNPPQNGAYKNVLLYYEANGASYLYSSDGIPTKLVNGTTDYTYTTNKPSINSVTLEGNKSSAELGLADSTLAIDIDPDNNTWSYDGTLQDIYDAFLAGRYVVLDASGSAPSAIPVVTMFYSPSIQDKLFVTVDYSATMSIGGQIDFADECGRAKIVLYPDNTMSISSQEFQNALTAGDGISIDSHYVIKAKAGDGLEIDSIGNIDIANLEQYAHFFDTVADMKNATSLSDGDYAKTGGFYSRNDGGSALYKVRTVTDSDTVDEMFIIAIGDGNLVAELIVDTKINSKQCGLKGDGTTDETAKLNSFFAISTDYDKILNKGIYLTSGTVFIKGRWADTYPTPYRIKFDQASIKYTGTNNCSVAIFDHKHSEIDGLNISTDSDENYIQIIGCWYSVFNNWVTKAIKIDTDPSLITSHGYSTTAVMSTSFNNLRVYRNKITLDSTVGSYINSVYFNNSVISSNDQTECVEFIGTTSFENITFVNSDLSYASTGVFKINSDSTASSGINLITCYLDSDIPMFTNNDSKNYKIVTIGTQHPSSEPILPLDFNKRIAQTHIDSYTFNLSNLANENVNYVKNGDISSSSTISEAWSSLFGPTSGGWDKSYITSPLNVNNRARRMELLTQPGTGNVTFNIETVNPPRDGKYVAYMRCKITGTFNRVDLHFRGYSSYYDRADIVGKEVLLVNARAKHNTTTANTFSLYMGVEGISNNDFQIEVYEVGVIMGDTYIPYPRLHELAKLS